MDVMLRTPDYFRELVQNHISGHMKVAPEHLHPDVLRRMRKPAGDFVPFLEKFNEVSEAAGKEQYLVPYFISSFPGCTEKEMGAVEHFLRQEKWNLQQVQDFIPLPMTSATAMYVTGLDINSGQAIPVVRNAGERERQKAMLRPQDGGAVSSPRGRERPVQQRREPGASGEARHKPDERAAHQPERKGTRRSPRPPRGGGRR
jgi:radical SAM superfamily enzyme YgiQ (UPF0313 family)